MNIITNLRRKQTYSDYSSSNHKYIEIETLNEFHRYQILSEISKIGISSNIVEFDEYYECLEGRFKRVPRKYNITINNVTEDIFNKIHNILFKVLVTCNLDFYGD